MKVEGSGGTLRGRGGCERVGVAEPLAILMDGSASSIFDDELDLLTLKVSS